MKKAKIVLIFVGILAILTGCGATGGRNINFGGGNNAAGLAVAAGVIGAAIIGHAFIGSKQAEVQKELIAANTVSNAACNLGGAGNARYSNTEGNRVEIGAGSGYSPEQCKEIKINQQSGYVRVGSNAVYGRANAYAICDQIPNPNGRNNCRQDVDQQIENDLRNQARDAARLRY